MRKPWPTLGAGATKTNKRRYVYILPVSLLHSELTACGYTLFARKYLFIFIIYFPNGWYSDYLSLTYTTKKIISLRFFNSCRRLPETQCHSCLFLHWSGSKFLFVMAAFIPSIHVILGRPLFLLSRGIQSIINFAVLSSGILLTWPNRCRIFCCIISKI